MPLALSLAALLVASPPSVSVSFTTLPLPAAMERLSDATGQRLEVAPALKEEVLFVRVRAVPAEALLSRIASVFAAEWVTKPDGTRILRPNAAAQRRDVDAALSEAKTTLRGSLAYLARRLAEQPALLDARAIDLRNKREAADLAARKRAEAAGDWANAARTSNAAEETPAWRALASILPTLGESTYLSIPNSAREVWAEHPTAMQHAFPIVAQTNLARYRTEFAIANPDADPVRIKLVLTKWELGGAFNAALTVTNGKGEEIDRAFARLANDSDRLKSRASRPAEPEEGNEKPLAISTAALEHQTLFGDRAPGSEERDRLIEKWRGVMLNPVKSDPLSWLPGEAIVASGKALDLNIVGTSADIQNLLFRTEPRPFTPSQYLSRMRLLDQVTPDRWLVLRPKKEVSRIPRALGRSLLQEAIRLGGLSVDSAADFAGRSPDVWPFTNWVGDTLYTMFPSAGPYSILSTTLEAEPLRLWFGFGEAGRSALRRGEVLKLAQLNPAAQRQIRKFVFQELRVNEQRDPTDDFPDGFTGGTVALHIEERPVFLSWESNAKDRGRELPLTAADFGRSLAWGNTYWELPKETFARRNRFRLGVNRIYHLDIVLEPGAVSMPIDLSETFFRPDGGVLDHLPPAVAADVEAARQKALLDPPATEAGSEESPPPN